MNWTDENDCLMFELWDAGVSATNIGLVLGTTKNSVVGRHKRLQEKGWTKENPVRLVVRNRKPVKVKEPKKDKPVKVKKGNPYIDLHPAFDPIGGVWFLEKPPVEAKSIAELLEKLPANSSIKDYVKGKGV